jgi:outer membrane lipoprotein LolB
VTLPLRQAGICLFLLATFLIAGCAGLTRAPGTFSPESSQWQGRLALKVQSTPVQAFSAHFDLQGNAQSGTLVLTTALGNTLASMWWNEDSAVLQTTGEPQKFESLPALVRHVTGTDLPVGSLFGWLKGQAVPAPGWVADISDLDNGRLSARHADAAGDSELKIILDR